MIFLSYLVCINVVCAKWKNYLIPSLFLGLLQYSIRITKRKHAIAVLNITLCFAHSMYCKRTISYIE